MADRTIHISEAEAANSFASLLARVRAGEEVIIEDNFQPIAVLRAAAPVRRTISACLALLPEHSTGTVDADFAGDVAAAIEGHRDAARTRKPSPAQRDGR